MGKICYSWLHSFQRFVYESFSLVNILTVVSISGLTFYRRSCKKLHTCTSSSEPPLEICLPAFHAIVITLGCAALYLTQSFLGLFPNVRGLGNDKKVTYVVDSKTGDKTPYYYEKFKNPKQHRKNPTTQSIFSSGNFYSTSTAVLLAVEW